MRQYRTTNAGERRKPLLEVFMAGTWGFAVKPQHTRTHRKQALSRSSAKLARTEMAFLTSPARSVDQGSAGWNVCAGKRVEADSR